MEIRIENISKSFGKRAVFRDFSCSFSEGRICCVLGPSGCGKTTLLRLIAGLEAPDSGTILGTEHKKISAVFQEDRLFETLRAEKNILLTARPGFSRTDACALLDELGIARADMQPVRSFSGGMKRRVAIARALANDYDILLLDEPMTGLDGENRILALNAIRRHASGRTVVCVTHDPADAVRLDAEILRL